MRTWVVIVVVFVLAWWFLNNGGGSQIPVISDSWDVLNAWFKTNTGVALDEIGVALWKLFLWLLKAVVGFIMVIVNQLLGMSGQA